MGWISLQTLSNTLNVSIEHTYDKPTGTITYVNSHTKSDGETVDYYEKAGGPLIGEEENAIGVSYFDYAKDDDETYADLEYVPVESAGIMNFEIERQSSGPANVQSRFEHTWSPGNIATFRPFVNTTISSKGGISIDIPSGADSWSAGTVKEIPSQ